MNFIIKLARNSATDIAALVYLLLHTGFSTMGPNVLCSFNDIFPNPNNIYSQNVVFKTLDGRFLSTFFELKNFKCDFKIISTSLSAFVKDTIGFSGASIFSRIKTSVGKLASWRKSFICLSFFFKSSCKFYISILFKNRLRVF